MSNKNNGSPRITVMCGRTVKNGENYERKEFTLDCPVTVEGDWAKSFESLHKLVSESLNRVAPLTQSIQVSAPTAPASILSSDPYEILPEWKQSSKRANLSTIMITEETLRNAVIQDLYDKLKLVGSLKVNSVTYKISDFAGKTFLQKWSNPTIGRSE